MSENKYIIDKDSLTGIADAIRDKLGNGEAGDSSAGYVARMHTISKLQGEYASGQAYYYKSWSWDYELKAGTAGNQGYYLTYFDEPWYTIEITGSSNLSSFSVNSTSITPPLTGDTRTHTFSSPQYSLSISAGQSTSSGTGVNAHISLTSIILKDASGNVLEPKTNTYYCYINGSLVETEKTFGQDYAYRTENQPIGEVRLPPYQYYTGECPRYQTDFYYYWFHFLYCDSLNNLTTIFGETPRYIRFTLTDVPTLEGASGITFDRGSDITGQWTSTTPVVGLTTVIDTSTLASNSHYKGDSNPIYLAYWRVKSASNIQYKYGYSPGWKFQFLNSSNEVLTPLGSNPQILMNSSASQDSSIMQTYDFETADINVIQYDPVPLSTEDMIDKITDYLEKSS